MARVICLGDLVVDWVKRTYKKKTVWIRHAAGTAANFAVGLARWGVTTQLLGRVGHDQQGRLLKAELQREGVDTQLLVKGEGATRQAWLEIAANGERKAAKTCGKLPSSKYCEDELCPEEIPARCFAGADAFYFGSTALCNALRSQATWKALRAAAKHDVLVVMDANLWPERWSSERAMVAGVRAVLPFVHVLKVSRPEFEVLAGTADLAKAEEFRARYGLPLLFVTLGTEGALAVTSQERILVAPQPLSVVKDKGGAGDAFFAAAIASLLSIQNLGKPLSDRLSMLSKRQLKRIICRGNVAGAIVCTRFGALSAMPTRDEVLGTLARKGRAA